LYIDIASLQQSLTIFNIWLKRSNFWLVEHTLNNCHWKVSRIPSQTYIPRGLMLWFVFLLEACEKLLHAHQGENRVDKMLPKQHRRDFFLSKLKSKLLHRISSSRFLLFFPRQHIAKRMLKSSSDFRQAIKSLIFFKTPRKRF